MAPPLDPPPTRRGLRERAASRDADEQRNLPDVLNLPSGNKDPIRVLMVCTGNICRSPLAELMLRARSTGLRLDVRSAGTFARDDDEMAPPAQALAIGFGVAAAAASAHRARYLVDSMVEESDLVLTMAREHRARIVQSLPRALRRTFTLREFARLSSSLSTEGATTAAAGAGVDPRERLRAVLLAVAAQRGVSETVPEDDDVIDPYRRSSETYQRSGSQIAPAIAEVERLLRATLS